MTVRLIQEFLEGASAKSTLQRYFPRPSRICHGFAGVLKQQRSDEIGIPRDVHRPARIDSARLISRLGNAEEQHI